jgi:putative transposase
MVIREAADPAPTSWQRGAMVRALADREQADPSRQPGRLTRWGLDWWIRARLVIAGDGPGGWSGTAG